MAVKTAEQHNAERRAAKQKQQAAAHARSVNGARSEEFDIREAARESHYRKRARKLQEESIQSRTAAVFTKLVNQGSIRLERGNQSYSQWVDFVFPVVKLIKAETRIKLQYNSEWKEVGYFAAGIVRN